MELERLREEAITALRKLADRHMYEWDIREAVEVEQMAERITAMREKELASVMTAEVKHAA